MFCLLPWIDIKCLARKEAAMTKQLLIMLASVAAALSLANLGTGGGP